MAKRERGRHLEGEVETEGVKGEKSGRDCMWSLSRSREGEVWESENRMRGADEATPCSKPRGAGELFRSGSLP